MGACEKFLDEHDSLIACDKPEHRRALDARRDRGTPWSPLVRRHEHGDFRDYLDGKPIHCGAGLELQQIAYRGDDFGEWTVYTPAATRVRYEIAWPSKDGGERLVILHLGIGGVEFTARAEPWMRFRWPSER